MASPLRFIMGSADSSQHLKIVVRKEISYIRMSDKEKNQLVAEFEILARLKHRNIVEYFHRDHIKKEQSIHLYMEYCGNGDLSTTIKRCKAEGTMVPEHYIWSIFAQVLQALYRCHNGLNPPEVGDVFSPGKPMVPQPTGDIVRILHRDLKPENSQYPLANYLTSCPGGKQANICD